MPGIVGIITGGPEEEKWHELNTMAGLLMHEGTYRKALYVDQNMGLYLGVVSHQGAFDDRMPVFNENGDIILFFSGETFDEPAVEYNLLAKGHSFTPGSASYLVHLYEEMGDSFFKKINGLFCGVLIDKRQKRAFLFNDRYGMKRLYYSEAKGALKFSTEAKSLILTGSPGRSFDERGLIELVICGCPLENRTLFQGVSLLPAGSRWTIQEKSRVSKAQYFDFSIWENQEVLSLKDFYPQFRETMRRILPRYIKPQPGVGISLTGGLDTRIIMAYAMLEPQQIPCYSFNGMYRDCNDVIIARKIASICGQEHRTINLDKSFLTEFQKYVEKAIWISEGVADLSAAVELYMNKIVREFSFVRLTGNYGGEVLRRSRSLGRVSRQRMMALTGLDGEIQRVKSLIDGLYHKHGLTFALLYDGPWHEYGRISVESSQLVQRTPYLDNDLISLMYQAPPAATGSKAISCKLIFDGNPRLTSVPTDRGYPLGMRTPIRLIRHAAVESLFKAEYFFNYGAPQWLAKTEQIFPWFRPDRLFLGRHKFYHFRSWFRDELSGFVSEILLDRQALNRSYIDAKKLQRIVQMHTRGSGNFTNEIHLAVTLELTSRMFLDH
jgi:asparagine synthase (glutamine-hydrolysing)